MITTVEIFDMLKVKHELHSDYSLARLLGVTPALICKHRAHPFGMSNELAMKCAALLKYDPAFVLAATMAERAKCSDERMAFYRLAGLALAYPGNPDLTKKAI